MNSNLRSYLAKYAAQSTDVEAIKRDAWRNDGHLVLMNEQIAQLTLPERRAIEQIATRQYGLKTIKGAQ
jgi:hypothetical protein